MKPDIKNGYAVTLRNPMRNIMTYAVTAPDGYLLGMFATFALAIEYRDEVCGA